MRIAAATAALLLCTGAATAAAATAAGEATLTPIIEGLDGPTDVAPLPDGGLLVAESQTSRARLFRGGRPDPEPFLDLADRMPEELVSGEGLRAIALPPGFPERAEVYATYDRGGEVIVARFTLGVEGRPDPASERILLRAGSWGIRHDCGTLVFSLDGDELYTCIGDMDRVLELGPALTPRPQDLAEVYGKVLRLDPSDPDADPEVVALGLRNPWQFTVDPETGELWVADAGDDSWEEVNLIDPAAAPVNLGWPLAEGGECLRPRGCDDDGLTWPLFEYPSTGDRCAVVGGAVYYGSRQPAWRGVYVFADFCSGEIWALRRRPDGAEVRRLLDADIMPPAVEVGPDGELLVLDWGGGAVHRLTLPDDADAGWRPADQVVAEAALEARRAGTGAAVASLDVILSSRRWAWSSKVADAARWLEAWLP